MKTVTFTDREACEVALSNAVLFTAKDRARPILCAARFELAGDAVKVISTDSYVIATEDVEVKAEAEAPEAWLIDRDDLAEMVRFCKSTAVGDLTLTFTTSDDNREATAFTFTNELGAVYAGRCPDWDYPNWRQLVDIVPGPQTALNLNPIYLAKLAKARVVGAKRDAGSPVGFELNQAGELKPVAWRIGRALKGVLMPVRCA